MADHSDEGYIRMDYSCDELGVDLECWFEYEQEELGSFDEPGYPEVWSVVHVYLPGSEVDIGSVLSDVFVERINEWAYEQGAADRQSAADEAAIDRWEDSREY